MIWKFELKGEKFKMEPNADQSKFTPYEDIALMNIPSLALYTIRTNLLNWCNLVSIIKNVVFYAFLVLRIY